MEWVHVSENFLNPLQFTWRWDAAVGGKKNIIFFKYGEFEFRKGFLML
jgi:hypothetical protein